MGGCQPLILLPRVESAVPPKTKAERTRQPPKEIPIAQHDQVRQDTLKWARRLVSQRRPQVNGRSFRADCSGFIQALAYGVGLDLHSGASDKALRGSGVELISHYIENNGLSDLETPLPGDLVFFSNTYDKNRDGRLNDELTHIGVIESLHEDGTLSFIHHIRGRVQRGKINLLKPMVHTEGNLVLNSYLRRRTTRDQKSISYTAGSLFSGFGSFPVPRQY